MNAPASRWARALDDLHPMAALGAVPRAAGRLTRVVGFTLEARGCSARLGTHCKVAMRDGGGVDAEVVGFDGDRLFLVPIGPMTGLQPGALVWPQPGKELVPAGEALLGRVVDPLGKPLDDLGPLRCNGGAPLYPEPLNPLHRQPIAEPFDVGVRAIDGLLTLGRGQRVGLFAPAGAGKSVLLGMMTRFAQADVIVVGLIGERGREVQEFITQVLGEAGMRRTVVVAAPADLPPASRLRGAATATAVAEYFRDQGKQVLLLMDSLTRFAQAQREVALAIGEPPATKGYPPSVFGRLGQLVERAGPGINGGSITAIYTVLTDGPDQADPIAEAARAILDGHIVLTRDLAEAGHYPAIDVGASVSRVMRNVVPPEQWEQAQIFRRHLAAYRQNIDLIRVGAYRAGNDEVLDAAVALYPAMEAYTCQRIDEGSDMHQARAGLQALTGAAAD